MPTITFIEPDLTARQVVALDGYSLMEAAIRADIAGIVAECGGECSCATCHVIVDPGWFDATGGPGLFEDQLLELAPGRAATSRLSCQIKLTGALDGLIVQVPAQQRS